MEILYVVQSEHNRNFFTFKVGESEAILSEFHVELLLL